MVYEYYISLVSLFKYWYTFGTVSYNYTLRLFDMGCDVMVFKWDDFHRYWYTPIIEFILNLVGNIDTNHSA